MYTQHQIKLMERAVPEMTRQLSVIYEMQSEYMKSRGQSEFEPTDSLLTALILHTDTVDSVGKAIVHARAVNPAIADHVLERNADAFNRVVEAFHAGNIAQDSDFARLVEQKKQEHAMPEEAKPTEEKPTEPAAEEAKPTEPAEAEEAKPTEEEAPAVPQTEAPPTEDVKPTEEAAAPEPAPKPDDPPKPTEEAKPVDVNAPCEKVQHATDGKCSTPAEALKTCQESGMRVEHAHAETEPAPEAKPTEEADGQ